MPQHDDGWTTRDAAAVRDRIADILGYCNRNGELHNPQNFEKKLLRSKWVCPDCNTVAGKVAYKRANELQWALVRPEETGNRTPADEEPEDDCQGEGSGEDDVEAGEEDTEPGEGDEADEIGQDAEPEESDDGSGIGNTDSEDVKARIENAQEDIEEFEEAAEQ